MHTTTFNKKDGLIISVLMEGHANAGTYGTDMVCMALSMAGQMAIIGLNQVLGFEGVSNEPTPDNPYICIDLTLEQAKKSKLLLETLYETLMLLENSYKEFVEVKTNEKI